MMYVLTSSITKNPICISNNAKLYQSCLGGKLAYRALSKQADILGLAVGNHKTLWNSTSCVTSLRTSQADANVKEPELAWLHCQLSDLCSRTCKLVIACQSRLSDGIVSVHCPFCTIWDTVQCCVPDSIGASCPIISTILPFVQPRIIPKWGMLTITYRFLM